MEATALPSLLVVPNPAQNQIIVVAPLGNHHASGDRSFTVSDPLGRSYDVPQNGNVLDVSSLVAGIYYIVSGGSISKFMKE